MKEIILGKAARKHKGFRAIVDDEDFEQLNKYRWYALRNAIGEYYAYRKNKIDPVGSNTVIAMHNVIMNNTDCKMVDHINHNTLDNRKSNLRFVTPSQNQMNMKLHKKGSSRFKGVWWSKQHCKWCAQIEVNGKDRYLGSFLNEIEAAKAYNKAAQELFGQFAFLNSFN
jgi:hypothetical protein